MRFLTFLAMIPLCLTGCAVDAASRHSGPPPVCEVHKETMHPEWIQVSPGYIGYFNFYPEEMRKRFPNHGRVILSGEREYSGEFHRKVRDFVCDDCTRAYLAYWETHSH